MNGRRGITLLELLVAMVLVTIVGYFASILLEDEKGNYTKIRERIKVQADAREGMRIMEMELRNAGFGTRILGTNRIGSSAEACVQVRTNSNGASLRATNNSSDLSVGDQIVFRMYEIEYNGSTGTTLTSCSMGAGSRFREVGYRLRSGNMERYVRFDTTSTINWVPFLEGVVTFQVQYGQDKPIGTNPWDTTQLWNSGRWLQSPTGVQPGGSSRTVSLRAWGTARSTWSTYLLSGPVLHRGETYRLRFRLAGNAPLLDTSSTGTITGYDRTSLFAGFVPTSGGDQFVDSMRIWAGDPTVPSPAVEIYLTPGADVASAQFAIKGRLMTGAAVSAPVQALDVSNLVIEQVRAGVFLDWVAAPTAAQLAATRAVRLTLLVKTGKKGQEGEAVTWSPEELGDPDLPTGYTASGDDESRTHVLLQRIIQVVNNGN